jgi:stage III sporulation protein AD
MEIIQIIGVGLIGVLLAVILKEYKPEFKIYISLICGIIIFFLVANNLKSFISLITSLSSKLNMNNEFLIILLKITGISILTEFAISICKDSGESAIAAKIDLGGKVTIIGISIPIITALLETLLKLI